MDATAAGRAEVLARKENVMAGAGLQEDIPILEPAE